MKNNDSDTFGPSTGLKVVILSVFFSLVFITLVFVSGIVMAGNKADQPERNRAVFSVGTNLGDVIMEGEVIHGEGVNLAARLS